MRLAEEFARTRFDQIESAITSGDTEDVRRLSELARAEYLPVHDGMRDVVGATLDFAARATSPAEGEAVGRRVIERLMGAAGDAPQYTQADLADRVRAITAGWHWHATRFEVSEDDEKVSFRLDPCGSGMRLEHEGRYDGPDGWLRSEQPSPSTFMQTRFPLYSNHCAEMTRAGLAAGNATFVVEGWRERDCGVCFQHTYKRVADVPAETYRRVGLERPKSTADRAAPGRLFTPDELAQLATHPLERAARVLEAGDVAAAQAALRECRDAWGIAMHGAYRRWITMLWAEVCEALGEDALERALAATAPELLRHRRGGSAHDWAAFWSMHLGLRSIRERGGETEFEVELGALVEPDVEPVTGDAFVDGLQRGMETRGWVDTGVFRRRDDVLVHVVGNA